VFLAAALLILLFLVLVLAEVAEGLDRAAYAVAGERGRAGVRDLWVWLGWWRGGRGTGCCCWGGFGLVVFVVAEGVFGFFEDFGALLGYDLFAARKFLLWC
jgi:hypothetical protein